MIVDPSKLRKIEAQLPDGTWVQAGFGQLEAGDLFRYTESDGRTYGPFRAKSSAMIDIEAEPATTN